MYSRPPTFADDDEISAANWNQYVRANFQAAVPDIFTAKGDIPVASGADTAIVLPVGANDTVLESRAGEASGRKWSTKWPVVGLIIWWYGSVANIPTGWVLCDGSNGTPDLRGKSVIGAGGAYNPGDTGGASTHNHTQAATGTENAHTHTTPAMTTGVPNSTSTAPSGATNTSSPTHTHAIAAGNTTSALSHSHSNPNVDSASTLPPFKALCFIVKVTH